MNAPNANVASVLIPCTAPPKMPWAQLPRLPVNVLLAESMRLGSMSTLCKLSLIQPIADSTWCSMMGHCWTMPTVMRASRANPPTTTSTVTMSAPQVRPTWWRSSQSTTGRNVAPRRTANRVGTTSVASMWSA